MASTRLPILRNLLDRQARPLIHVQRRWAQVHDVRFVATHQPGVLDRYKEKLQRKAEEEGHGSISSLKEAYQDKINAVRAAEANRKVPGIDLPSSSSPAAAAAASSTSSPSSSSLSSQISKKQPTTTERTTAVPGIKPLSSYLNLEKVRALPAKEVEALWRLRHASDPRSICAAIPLATYNRLAKTARKNPQFLLPLPREVEVPASTLDESKTSRSSAETSSSTDGATTKTTAAEMHFLQWGFHPPASPEASSISSSSPSSPTANTHTSTVIFTHLAQYKLHGAYSQPHTIITHHLDLADSCGLVLMNGTVLPDRGVSVDEARLLVMWLQKFYDWGEDGQQGGRKAEMLRMFSAGDVERFKIEELVEEVERV
ncbi:hypothetical protein VTO42DRAFT_7623 [Malbranchea cinnamomea]